MANTAISNTNLQWLESNWGGPASDDVEYDIYTFKHTPLTMSRELNGNDFSGGISVETFNKSKGVQVIVVWKESEATTTYTGNSSYISEGWA